jgi:hypothetical protein
LYQDDGERYSDVASYRRLVGHLLYLNFTRPNITFATQQVSQFMASPTITHHRAALRIVRYLKKSPGLGLFYPRRPYLQIQGYSDADWGKCPDTRRSISGYCFVLGSSLISWRSKKQHTVARSSTESEYRALGSAVCELLWLQYLLRDLHIQPSKSPVLFCDNHSAVHIAHNPVFHECTKHLEIDCHLVREKLLAGLFKLLLIGSRDQLVDFFTKGLFPTSFHLFLSKLGVLDAFTPSSLRGDITHSNCSSQHKGMDKKAE